ncbi:C-8 sterol isomerase [Paraphoma chrysanthemicola]|nr:C-8 sterol isomerase [Paraphoma chrysanthemicola]
MQLLTLLSIPVIFVSSALYFIISRSSNLYIFDPIVLHSLTHSALQVHGNNTAAVVSQLVSELSATHSKHVNLDEEWVFNNAGGAMGAMFIIHASLTEYLIIFGTALGTEGHTGRHTADDYFYILQGEELAYAPDYPQVYEALGLSLMKSVTGKGVYEPERYPQGSVHHLKRGQVKQYKMDSGCFALEYARGWIPGMLFFGFADTFTSTLDFYTLWRTVWITAREMVGNLMMGKL